MQEFRKKCSTITSCKASSNNADSWGTTRTRTRNGSDPGAFKETLRPFTKFSLDAFTWRRTMDCSAQKNAALLDYLRRHVDGEVRFDQITRRLYSTDASIYQIEPVGVVIPKTSDALQAAVQIALEMHVPIIARG